MVLTATGDRAFCVGADLKERQLMTDAQWLAQRTVFRAAFGELLRLPQPVIAAVHGYALGGGCELALNCDLVVADDTAQFGLPETTVGLVPGCGGTQLSMRRLGVGRAADLLLTGRRVEAPRRPSGSGWPTGWSRPGPPTPPRWRWPAPSPPTPRSPCGPPSGPCARAGGSA